MGEALQRAGNAAHRSGRPVSRGSCPLQHSACQAPHAHQAARLRRGEAASPCDAAGVSAWIPMVNAWSSCRHINKSCCSRLWGGSWALGCQAACVTSCRRVASDGGWIPPSKSIPQRSSRVLECVVEEQQLAGLLFCPAEEALPGQSAYESWLGGARERSVTLTLYFSFPLL